MTMFICFVASSASRGIDYLCCRQESVLFGQVSERASLVGTVLDATGSAVPKAQVDVKNIDTNVTTFGGDRRSRGLSCGELAGRYVYRSPPPPAGFAGSTLENVTVDANKIATANLTVTVATASTTVEVHESAAVIDTTTATIQNTFDARMVRDLPVSTLGLGVANLALLNAGVGASNNIGTGEGPSIGGQRPYSNNFMIEGVDANNKAVTGSLIRTVPNDAVSEFNILQNQENAQYGHSSGGQFNVILKSGTNAFHGTAYEYLENRNLNAIDQVVQTSAIQSGERPIEPALRQQSIRWVSVGRPHQEG